MIADIVAHSQNGQINFSPEVEAAYAILKDFMYSTVYVDKEAKREEKKVDKLIEALYERLCADPSRMPNFYLQIAYNEGVDRAATDYISGMSDEFATRGCSWNGSCRKSGRCCKRPNKTRRGGESV